MDEHINNQSISEFYNNANIFITGGSGFVGKALIEKLLRSCSNINSIKFIMRPKKRSTVEERMQEFFNSEIFKKIRQSQPKLLNKVKAVGGDIRLPNLNLDNEEIMSIVSDTNIVFHAAASVRFNESLEDAIAINTSGTEMVLELCKEMKNLKSFVHVSTAFAVPSEDIIEERVYKSPHDPHIILKCLKVLPTDMAKVFTKKILGKHPNTYTFTKSMAEFIVEKNSSVVPSAIVRPSIVSPAWKEPYPGWVDNISGATGIVMGCGTGIVGSILGEELCEANLIPVDIVVNTLITVAWHMNIKGYKTLKVYHCTSGLNPLTWQDVRRFILKHSIEFPSKYVTWYPNFSYTTSRTFFFIYTFMFSLIPASLLDIFSFHNGRRNGVLKISWRAHKAVLSVSPFTLKQFMFGHKNMKELIQTFKDCELVNVFNIDINHKDFDWDTYIKVFILGIRQYILNDSRDSLSDAKRKLHKGQEWRIRLHSSTWAPYFNLPNLKMDQLLRYTRVKENNTRSVSQSFILSLRKRNSFAKEVITSTAMPSRRHQVVAPKENEATLRNVLSTSTVYKEHTPAVKKSKAPSERSLSSRDSRSSRESKTSRFG